MNADQKQRAAELLAAWRATTYALHGDRMAALLQELVDGYDATAESSSLIYHGDGTCTLKPGVKAIAYGGDTSTNLIGLPPVGEMQIDAAPPAPSVPDMPLSMEQFGGLVGLARDDAKEKAIVYKATNIYGETCYFGVKSTAQAWAKSGSVDEVRLRDLRVVATPTQPEPPADVARDAERLDWLLRKLPGDTLRYCVGELSDTSDGKEFRDAIDAARERQGGE